MSNGLINSVRNYLVSHHMFVVDEWLSGFIEYFTEENGTGNIKEIQNCAREQWLLNNLTDICPGSLPQNISNQHKCVLNGKFVLQINAAVDIGTPAYQQYLKLKKVNMENVEATVKFEDKIPSHRMIKLYMTDGKQEVSGIEYKPMRNISCDITPGSKVMIKGPVECRRGVMLLTEANVERLGGEVEDIVGTNSLHGILAAKFGSLNLPESNNTEINIEIRNLNIPPSHTEAPRNNGIDQNNSHSAPPNNNFTAATNFEDDDIDFEQLEAIEAQLIENPVKRPMVDDNPKPEKKLKMNPEPVNIVEDFPTEDDNILLDEDDYFRQMENDLINRKERPTAAENPKPEKILKINPEPVNTVEDYPTEDDLLLDEEDYFRQMEADSFTLEEKPKAAADPFAQVKDIISSPEEARKGKVFKIRGQIIKLLSKLSVGKDKWSLKCTIVDDSDDNSSIDVEFTSDVLSKVVGYTPHEMNEIKKQMSTQPELKEKAVLALQKAKETLQVRCIIELTMSEQPTITKFTPIEEYR